MDKQDRTQSGSDGAKELMYAVLPDCSEWWKGHTNPCNESSVCDALTFIE